MIEWGSFKFFPSECKISADALGTVEAFQTLIEPISKDVSSIDELNTKIVPIAQNFLNTTRLQSNRGWTPYELINITIKKDGGNMMPSVIVPGSSDAAKNLMKMKPYLDKMGIDVDLSGMGQYTEYGMRGEKRKVKLYPNDPCPCGSGKKYKKCHGRSGGIDSVYKGVVKL